MKKSPEMINIRMPNAFLCIRRQVTMKPTGYAIAMSTTEPSPTMRSIGATR